MANDQSKPITYPAPAHLDLSAKSEALNRNPFVMSNELQSKVAGTTAKVTGKPASLHPTFGGFDKTGEIHSKVASDSVKESAKHHI